MSVPLISTHLWSSLNARVNSSAEGIEEVGAFLLKESLSLEKTVSCDGDLLTAFKMSIRWNLGEKCLYGEDLPASQKIPYW